MSSKAPGLGALIIQAADVHLKWESPAGPETLGFGALSCPSTSRAALHEALLWYLRVYILLNQRFHRKALAPRHAGPDLRGRDRSLQSRSLRRPLPENRRCCGSQKVCR